MRSMASRSGPPGRVHDQHAVIVELGAQHQGGEGGLKMARAKTGSGSTRLMRALGAFGLVERKAALLLQEAPVLVVE